MSEIMSREIGVENRRLCWVLFTGTSSFLLFRSAAINATYMVLNLNRYLQHAIFCTPVLRQKLQVPVNLYASERYWGKSWSTGTKIKKLLIIKASGQLLHNITLLYKHMKTWWVGIWRSDRDWADRKLAMTDSLSQQSITACPCGMFCSSVACFCFEFLTFTCCWKDSPFGNGLHLLTKYFLLLVL